MATLQFAVIGHPEPAGSKRAFQRGGRIVVVDDNPKSKAWKNVVGQTAAGAKLAARLHRQLQGPLYVRMTFHRLRPQSHLLANGELSAEGRRNQYPTTKPDLLKYARAVEDAMTDVVYRDDAQIVSEMLLKQYGGREGVEVLVMEMEEVT